MVWCGVVWCIVCSTVVSPVTAQGCLHEGIHPVSSAMPCVLCKGGLEGGNWNILIF